MNTRCEFKLHNGGVLWVDPEEVAAVFSFPMDVGFTSITLKAGTSWLVYGEPLGVLRKLHSGGAIDDLDYTGLFDYNEPAAPPDLPDLIDARFTLPS